MLRLHEIDSLDLPELAPYRTMKQQTDHEGQGIFVAEGEKVVRRLIESSLPVVSIVLPREWLLKLQPLLERRTEAIDVYLAEKRLLERLTGFSMYQGLLAVSRIPASITLPQAMSQSAPPRLFAAVDGLSDAQNLGGLVRNCVAFGAQSLLVGETSINPYLRRAVRASMGTVFRLPIVQLDCLAAALKELRRLGTRCLGAHPHAASTTVYQADLTGDCCIVFGSEGNGLSREVIAACDETLEIPMPPGVDSLNVGSAAAVFLYEAARQRNLVAHAAPRLR